MRQPAGAPDPIDEAVGAALRQLRRSREVSRAALAHHVGVSHQQIHRYERGDNRMTASVLFRIADFFGIGVGDLFALANAIRGRASAARLVVLTVSHDVMQHFVPEQELVGAMSNYLKISDSSSRDSVNRLMERLAAEPSSERGSLNGARDKWKSP